MRRVQTAVLLALGTFFFVPSASAATIVSENIVSDTTWTREGSPYVINEPADPLRTHFLRVAAGATLTLEPGVVVKSGAYNGIGIEGTLRALGTAESPIIFTSLADDVGGDTNSDGDATTPTDEQWMYLLFYGDQSVGTFSYTTIQYGGMHITVAPNTGIENHGGTITLDHSTITHNGFDGLLLWGGSMTLTDCDISYHQVGITFYEGSLTLRNTRVHHNTVAGVDAIWYTDVLPSLVVERGEIDHNGAGIIFRYNGTASIADSSIYDNVNADGIRAGILNNTRIIGEDENGQQIVANPGASVSATNTWWGAASGPHNPLGNPGGAGDQVTGVVSYTPWRTTKELTPIDPCTTTVCASNVLFLPGIEGSRLYEGTGCGKTAEEKLWDPIDSYLGTVRGAGDGKVRDLVLTEYGESACADIYAKEGDIIGSVDGTALYAGFESEMDGLKRAGTINDWKAVAYDWRLSLPELLTRGNKRDGKIYYTEATSTPYIEQTLRDLASRSKSGKVTIVAHSNGGLLTKAMLIHLGSDAAKLVDKVVLVGVPQTGAPAGAGSLLVGYQAGIYGDIARLKGAVRVVSNQVARAFSQNSPMAYHLLPSAGYFTSVINEPTHPVIHFTGEGYEKERASYGNSIVDAATFSDFLVAKSGEREKPRESDLLNAEILNPNLVAYAVAEHALIDAWTPPTGITVTEVAGWGVDTVAGIDFYSLPGQAISTVAAVPARVYRPILVEDGDGTVPTPSALYLPESANVKRYWVDLHSYNKLEPVKRTHKDLFEIPSLQQFIQHIVGGTSPDTLPAYFSTARPAIQDTQKSLTFTLHSPLTLQLTDEIGRVTGLAENGSTSEDIPGSSYGEFGEVKYVSVPAGAAYQLHLVGQAGGTFSIDIAERSGGVVTTSSTIANVPTMSGTLASLSVSPEGTASPLSVDLRGDGKQVFEITPENGETVVYTPPASAPSAGAGGGEPARSISPVLVPILQERVATSTAPEPVFAAFLPARRPVATSSRTTLSSRPVARAGRLVPAAPPLVLARGESPRVQVAAVSEARGTSLFSRVGQGVYTRVQGLWLALRRLF